MVSLFTGTIELISAILLLVPRLFRLSGVARLHDGRRGMTNSSNSAARRLPALVLGCLAAFILWLSISMMKAFTRQAKTRGCVSDRWLTSYLVDCCFGSSHPCRSKL